MTLSRRDFLKLSTAGLAALALSELRLSDALALEAPASFQGRATYSGVPVYDAPSFNAKQLSLLNKDQVVDVLAHLNAEGAHNKVWYRFAGGYTYSGWLQPCRTILQTPVTQLPHARALGEVTVPFLETRRGPFSYSDRSMRLYYGSTHWIQRIITNETGTWYEIYDSYLKLSLFVSATEMRIVPDLELGSLSPNIPDALKFIHVDLRTQYVTAFEDQKLVFRSRCSSGAGRTKTPLGDYQTYHKGPSIHMSNEGDSEINIYSLPGVPWVSFFTGTGIAFHGTYWHNDFGKPRSHGCINLPNSAAKFIYRWTSPTVPPETEYLHQPKTGTKVQVVRPED